MKSIAIEEFISRKSEGVVIDVRTPAEFEKGRIPGAVNLPLFSDEERVIIGTIYKQQGRKPAIVKGLEMTGPKMKDYIKAAEGFAADNNKVFLYCWRGGMRSGSMGWLLDLYGFEVYTLKRGYKAFRNCVLESFKDKKDVLILGGKTGSGKTIILHELVKLGEQVIDLEGLAHHKGSAFGMMGESETCSQEHFENKLAMEWLKVVPGKTVWIEDESRSIGKKIIPEGVWNQMRDAWVVQIEIDKDQRLDYVTETYGLFPKEQLLAATEKVKKRLGGLAYKQVIAFINDNMLREAAEILLAYYDKGYKFGIEMRNEGTVYDFKPTENGFENIAKGLLEFTRYMRV